jgi:two-component system chemotaxis response regulator CheB
VTGVQTCALPISQDEATSIIFGMPGEAVRLGAAERVLPLPAIAPALAELVSGGRR